MKKLGPVLLTVLLDLLGFGLVIPLLPYFAEQYGATGQQAMALMGVYSVAQFLFAPAWGALSDRIGRRPVMLVSIAGTAAMLAAFASTSQLWLLFVWRFLHGACAANISTAQAYVADVTTDEDRAKGMGLIGASFGVGFTLGPWVGGELGSAWGLAAPIWLAAGLSAGNLVWAFFGLPESRPVGDRGTARRILDPRALARGLAHPVVGLVLLLTFAATFAFSMMEVTFGLVAEHVWYPELGREAVAARVGRMFGLIGIVGIVIQGGLIGRLARRFGEPALVAVGYLATATGLVSLTWASGGPEALAACGLLAVGTSLANPSLQALISRGVGDDEQGWVLGVNQSLSALARAVAPWSAVLLYGLAELGIPGVPVDETGAFRGAAFLVSAAVMVGALALSIPAARRASAPA